MNIKLLLANLLVAAGYVFFSGQTSFFVGYGILYLMGILLLKIVFRAKSPVVINLYSLFFAAYSLLVLLSQAELIENPASDFYIHNDACDSFYPAVMDLILPCAWSDLIKRTLFMPYFLGYPFAALIFGFFGKLGMSLGIVDLRLFLRLHSVLIGALTIGIMAQLLAKKSFTDNSIRKLIIPFGMFTYLYVTSAIFTRDVHVCLVYSIGAYVCLSDNIKHKLLPLTLCTVMAFGLRPVNGLVFMVYPCLLYYDKLKQKAGVVGPVFLALILLIGVYYSSAFIKSGVEGLSYYDTLAKTNTGGIFITLYSLPFPFNTLVMIVYMLLMPLPMTAFIKGPGCTWLNLPTVLSPYIIIPAVIGCIYFFVNNKTKNNIVWYVILASFLSFAAITYGSPDIRRAFAAMPSLYMCFCLIKDKLPAISKSYKKTSWTAITIINVFFMSYILLR